MKRSRKRWWTRLITLLAVLTAVLAWVVFKENVDRRIALAARQLIRVEYGGLRVLDLAGLRSSEF